MDALEAGADVISADLARASGGPAAEQQQAVAQRLLEALGALEQKRSAVQSRMQALASNSAAQRVELLQQLLQPAAQVGAALQSYYELPEQRAAARPELARVAATRRCAYLRCNNLEADSGRIRTCSACKAVRYCGTACSHADWRAGHRRVCKLLAAEREEQAAGGEVQQQEEQQSI